MVRTYYIYRIEVDGIGKLIGTRHQLKDAKEAVEFGELIFIAVGTPEDENGDADLSYVYQSAKEIGMYMNDYKVVVDKSTVPIGTSRDVAKIIKQELENRKEELAK